MMIHWQTKHEAVDSTTSALSAGYIKCSAIGGAYDPLTHYTTKRFHLVFQTLRSCLQIRYKPHITITCVCFIRVVH